MKKLIFPLFVFGALMSFQGYAQNCGTAVPVLDENFNSQPDPSDRTILQDCWGIYYTFRDRDREIGSVQATGTAIAMNSTYGAELYSPMVRNTQGTLSFKATGYSGKTLEIGTYSGSTFNLLGTATMSNSNSNFSFDFSSTGSASSDNFYFRFASNTGSSINIELDDIYYVSKCDNPGDPTAIAKDIELTLAAGESSVTLNPASLNDGSVDDCGLPVTSYSVDKTTFTCDDLGDNIVSFTVTDSRGATDNVLATVTVLPFMALSVSQYADVQLDENGEASFTLEELNSDLSTQCSGLTYSIDKLSFTCVDLTETQNITLTATYNGSVIKEYTHPLFIRDTLSPKSIVTNDLDLTLDEATGIVTILPEDLFVSAIDNCTSSFTLAASQIEFSCSDVGVNSVVLTVDDESGNSSSVEVVVNVSSTIADQTITTTTASYCPDGSAITPTVDMASSELNVNYFLRNSTTDAIIDGPIAGTGGALSFDPGSITETTSVYVFAQSVAAATDYGLDFDGTNDKVATSYSQAATSELTIEGWIYPRAATTNMILSNYDGSGLKDGDMFFDNQGDFPYTGRALRINFLGVGNDRHILVVQDVLTLNEWNHVATTFDNGAVKLFVNGIEVAANTANFTTIPAATTASTFGQHTAATSTPFDGQMDEFRVWNTARTATELLNNKDSRLTGSETGLAAYYNFDEGTGVVLTDLVNGANGTLTNMSATTDWINGVGYVESNICDVSMSTEITFGDGELPTAIAQNISGQLDETGNFTISARDLNNGSSDNCTTAENLIFSIDQIDFDCTMIGANDVTLSVTDESGNTGTATATVTIISSVEDQTISAAELEICPGTETTITMAASQSGYAYTLHNAADDSSVGDLIIADGGSVNFSTGLLTESSTFYVTASETAATMDPHFALDFDGQNDRVATSYAQSATDELTIEGWIYPRATTTNKFLSNYNDSGSLKPGDMFFDIYHSSSNNGKGLRMSLVGAGSSRLTLQVANVLELNTWNHVAFTFDNGAAKLYVDGVEVGSSTANFTSVPAAVSYLWFGEDSGNSEQDHFNGKMDDFRIWNTARTADEILVNKDSELFGTETNLAAYFNFNNGEGYVLSEQVNGANGSLQSMHPASDWVTGAPISSKVICMTSVGAPITITAEDTESPVVLTQDISLVLDANGNATIAASDIENGSTDNCTAEASLTYSLDITTFDINDLGENTVTLSVTDLSGNIGTATATVTVSDKEKQVATFTGVADKIFGDADFTISASVDSSLPVTFTVTAGGLSIASSTSSSADFSIIGTGVATIEVTNDGDDTYAPLHETLTITVAKAEQTLTIDEVTTKYVSASPIDIIASIDTGLSLDYEVTGPATISGNTVTLDGTAGTVQVSVSQIGNDNYNEVTGSITFEVIPREIQNVTFTGVADKTFGDADFTISATIDSSLPITYTVIDGGLSIASSTSTSADFSIIGAGVATIEATNDGDDTYAPLKETITINVAKADQTLTIDEVTTKSIAADPITISASVSSGLSLDYAVTGPATVSGNMVTLDGTAGTVQVTVTQSGNDNYNEVSGTISFEVVEKQSQTITFTDVPDVVYGAADQTLTATASSSLAVSFALISGPATLNGSTLSITGVGDVVVEASQAGDDDFLSASVQQTFNVSKATLTISADDKTINYGESLPILTYSFSGFVNGEGENDLNSTISISTTASLVKGQPNAGTYPIALSVVGSEVGDNYSFSTEDATLTINKLDQVIGITAIDDKEPTDAAFDVVATVDSDLDLTYEVSGPATISGTTITLDGTEGTVTITASQAGDVNHNAATASITFEVAVILGLGDGLSEAISIYPNPVMEYVMIDTDELVSVRFYGLNGQILKSFDQVNGKLDVTDLHTGTYLMEVSNTEEKITVRIHKAN